MTFILTIFAIIVLVIVSKLFSDKYAPFAVITVIVLYIASIAFLWITPFVGSVPGYSDGCRTLYLEKFSNKGMFYKTWEGTGILMGFNSSEDNPMQREEWYFSAKDADVVNELKNLQGKRVTICYEQNYVTAYEDGDSYYMAVSAEEVKD